MGIQHLGEWRLTRSAAPGLPKGLDFVLQFTDLAVVVAVDGDELASADIGGTTFENWGGPNGMLNLAGRQLEIEAIGKVTPRDLQEALFTRKREGPLSSDVLNASGSPAVVVWSYPGRTQADAGQVFARHAQELAGHGYIPVAQSWADGRPGWGRVFMIGVFAGSIRPKGYLTVTYQLKSPPAEPASGAALDPLDQIRRLGELRDAGVVTPDEFERKKADLLERL